MRLAQQGRPSWQWGWRSGPGRRRPKESRRTGQRTRSPPWPRCGCTWARRTSSTERTSTGRGCSSTPIRGTEPVSRTSTGLRTGQRSSWSTSPSRGPHHHCARGPGTTSWTSRATRKGKSMTSASTAVCARSRPNMALPERTPSSLTSPAESTRRMAVAGPCGVIPMWRRRVGPEWGKT